jgi:hypothetical protein
MAPDKTGTFPQANQINSPNQQNYSIHYVIGECLCTQNGLFPKEVLLWMHATTLSSLGPLEQKSIILWETIPI